MLPRRTLLLALSAMAASPACATEPKRDPAQAPAGRYRLDPRRASLRVRMPVLGGLYTYGLSFLTLSGGFTHDPADWRRTRVTIVIDPRSAAAEPAAVARALVKDLEPERFPEIRFESRSAALDADGRGTLAGDLTMHGVTRPIVLDVAFKGLTGGATGARLGFSGAGRVRRSDFGLSVGRPFADAAEIVFDVEFVRT